MKILCMGIRGSKKGGQAHGAVSRDLAWPPRWERWDIYIACSLHQVALAATGAPTLPLGALFPTPPVPPAPPAPPVPLPSAPAMIFFLPI